MIFFLLIFPLKKTAASNMLGPCDQWCQYWCATPPTTGQQCHWHRPLVVSGVIDTAHHWPALPLTPPTSSQTCHWHRPPAVSWCHWHLWPQYQQFQSRISPWIRIFKKALTPGSVSQEELFDEKTKGRKSRDTVPLKLRHDCRKS
jgi:hypothetical protein